MPNDFRALLAVLHDLVAVTVAWLLAFWLRFNLEIPEPFREQAWASVIWVVPLYGIIFYGAGLYRGIWRYASVSDIKRIVLASGDSQAVVDRMLAMGRVTAQDYLIDLGSGDGRNIIAAAKRGARALGVEYNPDMVELSRRMAEKAGVGDKAQFVQGDMYVADISQATVLALFLLPENLNKLAPKFLALKPGSRIVANHFAVSGWEPDESGRAEGDCGSWCNWLLYIVPAKAEGRWRFHKGELELEQKFQMLSGKFTLNGMC